MSTPANPGAIVWLTGLSGAGKSTLATLLQAQLVATGHQVGLLDGDELRRTVCADLGFSPADRIENMRRAAAAACQLARTGQVAIVALISPFSAQRAEAKEIARASGLPFFEIYIACPLEVCERRDPKGLYRKARAGQISSFTGIDAAYEAPAAPDLLLDTGGEPPEASARKLAEFVTSALRLAGQSPA